jgi:predicted nuclease of restriction endonuclease-like (RecB) superfamily
MTSKLALYQGLLADIKARVRRAQHKAALSANAEMVLMYWDVGRLIASRQHDEGWGTSVIPRLAVDLKNELPEQKGFSPRNLSRMIAFFRAYPILPQAVAKLESGKPAASPATPTAILPQAAAKLVPPSAGAGSSDCLLAVPWSHHIVLIEKVKDFSTRIWYARQVVEQGWSREALTAQIKQRAHERQGTAVTNFATTLPEIHASLATGLLKDPYLFDFLTLEEPFHERELETGLLTHLQKFLLELGRGFAFVGRQYRLEVSDREFYLDLLFYHLHLRCFVVVELKRGDFKPEYAGKMNFYCSVVDDQLRHPQDLPTLGLILCQTKDRVLAEYALRDIHKPIGIADYELTRALPSELASSLPSIEAIEAELSRELDEERSQRSEGDER